MKKDKYIGTLIKPYDDSLKAQVGRWQHHDIELIAKTIIDTLKINQTDRVLDLCCGNGLITNIVAKHCQEIHGVDFSGILIETANKENKSQNVHYYLKNVLKIDELFQETSFDKVYCYFAFQHLNYEDGEKLVGLTARVVKQNGLILIGDIPDKRKKLAYYNTDTLRKWINFIRAEVIRQVFRKEDIFGWWWSPDQIKGVCKKLKLKCEFPEQDKKLPHAHYRFDVLISLNNEPEDD
ncbi:class I SAM-dependent methyltransferase [Dehalococcoidia bacterium]|nr:class I SAM-dependent methyltransferase [Dehalococcoidia bacterium]